MQSNSKTNEYLRIWRYLSRRCAKSSILKFPRDYRIISVEQVHNADALKKSFCETYQRSFQIFQVSNTYTRKYRKND
ncbi:hypothetical protein JTB14_013858 [Gonioctena quinquepunctata]|nr:hypothetical protein JTB14_013858 [Gonioctena quinquepunctata]